MSVVRKAFLFLLSVMLLFAWSGPAFAWEPGGRWLLEGGGYAEKGVLRARLGVDGHLNVRTETLSGDLYLTGYDVRVRLDASLLNINAWNYSKTVVLRDPVPVPKLNPTTGEPYRLPAVTYDGLTYVITFLSTESGKVDIYGELDVDVVGMVDIDSSSVIWREGTAKPDREDMTSGCNVGAGVGCLLFLVARPLFGFRKKRL